MPTLTAEGKLYEKWVANLKPPRPAKQFFKALKDDGTFVPLFGAIHGEFSFKESDFEELLMKIYSIMEQMVEIEKTMYLVRKSKGLFTKSAVRLENAKKNVISAIEAVNRAEHTVQPDLPELRRGVLVFRPSRCALKELQKSLETLTSFSASMIHPRLRTAREKKLASSYRANYKLWDSPYSPNQGSADIQNHVVQLLEQLVRRFFRHRTVAPGGLDKFISCVFKAAGRTLTDDNVKVIRSRNKNKKKLKATAVTRASE